MQFELETTMIEALSTPLKFNGDLLQAPACSADVATRAMALDLLMHCRAAPTPLHRAVGGRGNAQCQTPAALPRCAGRGAERP